MRSRALLEFWTWTTARLPGRRTPARARWRNPALRRPSPGSRDSPARMARQPPDPGARHRPCALVPRGRPAVPACAGLRPRGEDPGAQQRHVPAMRRFSQAAPGAGRPQPGMDDPRERRAGDPERGPTGPARWRRPRKPPAQRLRRVGWAALRSACRVQAESRLTRGRCCPGCSLVFPGAGVSVLACARGGRVSGGGMPGRGGGGPGGPAQPGPGLLAWPGLRLREVLHDLHSRRGRARGAQRHRQRCDPAEERPAQQHVDHRDRADAGDPAYRTRSARAAGTALRMPGQPRTARRR